MCDVVDKVSFAEVDGDLSIGGALLEHPGALLLARARHPHPRRAPVRLLTSHQHQLTSDHNFTQFTFTILTTPCYLLPVYDVMYYSPLPPLLHTPSV